MPELLAIKIDGDPKPQGSKSVTMRSGKPVLYEASGKLSAWRQKVAAAARWVWSGREPIPADTPVTVELRFTLPAGAVHAEGDPHIYRPDLDKLIRAVLDSLTTAGVLSDDAQVQKLHAVKEYSNQPGVQIKVSHD